MADPIASFLDQYEPETVEPTVTPSVEPAIAQPANDAIGNFLDQYEKGVEPTDQPPPDVRKPMEPWQAEAMTHYEKPDVSQYKIRPKVVGEAVKKGFADFAALPGYAVDILNWPLYKAGITPEKAVGGSDMIRRGWQLLTDYQEIKPETTAEKYAAKVGEFAGSGITPGAALLRKAATRAVKPATTGELASILGAEVASAVTGGVGAEFFGGVGEQAWGPPGRTVGELFGGLSGGMAPIYFKTAGATIWNATKAALTVTKYRASFLEDAAKAKIAQSMSDPAATEANIQRAMALQQEIPGFKPSLAAATDSPGLAARQAQLDSQSVENFNRATSNITKAQEAIDHYYAKNFSISGDKLTAKEIFRNTLRGMKEQTVVLDRQIEDLAAQYKRQPLEQIGERLRELRAIRKGQVKLDKDQAYVDLYKSADDLGVVDDVSDLYQLSRDFVTQDATVFQRMPGVYAKIRQVLGRDIKPPEEALDATGSPIPAVAEDQLIMANFQKMHSLYRETSKQYGAALKSGDSEKQFYLGQIKELLDQKLAKFDDPTYGTFAEHKKAVDSYWLEEYHNVFRKGVGGKIPNETKFGQVTPDEKIVSSLVMQKGTARGVQEFNKVYEDVPEAQILLRDGILDMFATNAIKDGRLDPKQAKAFLKDYEQVFDNIPDLRNTFMNSEALTTAMVNRKATIVRKSKQFAKETISPYARIAGFDSPHAAVQAGINDPKIMRILTRQAKTEAERQDLTTVLADVVLEQKNPWEYILKNEDKLASHFNRLKPGHFQKLKNIAEAQSIVGRYDPHKVIITSTREDPIYKKFGTTFASAWAQMRWAMLYGKTSASYPVADMGSKYLYKMRSDKIDEIMDRTLYDPDLAKAVEELTKLKKIDPGDLKLQQTLEAFGLHTINNGIRAGSVAASEENQQ